MLPPAGSATGRAAPSASSADGSARDPRGRSRSPRREAWGNAEGRHKEGSRASPSMRNQKGS
eukprot:1286067-Heterocapsa_arctica.AAC.1